MNETTAFWSGHANSSAMVARMIEIGTNPDRIVHACTGLEFEEVYTFMDKFEKFLGIDIIYEDITQEKPEREFWNWFYKPWIRGNMKGEIHGSPKTRDPCWHNRNIKQPVFKKYEAISSETYAGFTVHERHRQKSVGHNKARFPLIEWQWSAEDSLHYLRKRGIPHLIYEKYGFERMGCCVCPKQSDSSLFLIYKHFPNIWDKILEMEDKSPNGFRSPDKKTPYQLMDLWEKRRPDTQLSQWVGCEQS